MASALAANPFLLVLGSPPDSGPHRSPYLRLPSCSSCPSQGWQRGRWRRLHWLAWGQHLSVPRWTRHGSSGPSRGCHSPAGGRWVLPLPPGNLAAAERAHPPEDNQDVARAQPPAFLQVNRATLRPSCEGFLQRGNETSVMGTEGGNPRQPHWSFTPSDAPAYTNAYV